MNELFARALIAVLLISIATVLAVRIAKPSRASFGRLPPRQRVVAIELALALPWLVPAVVVGAALAPSILALLWPAMDHCGAHDDQHEHFCLMHPPHGATSSGWAALALVLVVPAVLRLIEAARGLARARAEVERVRLAARRGVDGTLRVASDLPMCAAIGLSDTAILVSDGARARVSAAQLAIMLDHERAHVARRDVLRHALALLAASAHSPATAKALLDELSVAREQACDEAAAAVTGDRLSVAEAILHAARVFGSAPALPTMASAAFGPDAIASRVTALLADPLPLPGAAIPAVALAITITVGLLPGVHHALETLLGALLH